MSCAKSQNLLMFLGYTDDSGRFDKKQNTYQVLATVLVQDRKFVNLEHVVGNCVFELLPEDKWEEFKEFHAWELYGGHGIFEEIEQEQRFLAIKRLLTTIRDFQFPIVFGAVNVAQLQQKFYASADPIDTAFRMCIKGIDKVVRLNNSGGEPELALLIVDESNRDNKNRLKRTYKELRRQIRPPHWNPGTWFIHDDMYFGASQDSIGIQLADLCSYFIRRHLENDAATEHFYQMFSDFIKYSKIEPEEIP